MMMTTIVLRVMTVIMMLVVKLDTFSLSNKISIARVVVIRD